MTQLLISVRSLPEARAARLPGVEWIDLKEPFRGSLGCPDWKTAREISQNVPGPLSIALGELNHWQRPDERTPFALGFQFAKVGLAGMGSHPDWKATWLEFAANLPSGTVPVPVAYADWQNCYAPPIESVFELARQTGNWTVLIDTYDKQQGRLFDHLSASVLREIQENYPGLRLALAGSLQLCDRVQLAGLVPEIIGLRGAVCECGRESQLSPVKIADWIRFCRSLSDSKSLQRPAVC